MMPEKKSPDWVGAQFSTKGSLPAHNRLVKTKISMDVRLPWTPLHQVSSEVSPLQVPYPPHSTKY
jgi:hypothetical protein